MWDKSWHKDCILFFVIYNGHVRSKYMPALLIQYKTEISHPQKRPFLCFWCGLVTKNYITCQLEEPASSSCAHVQPLFYNAYKPPLIDILCSCYATQYSDTWQLLTTGTAWWPRSALRRSISRWLVSDSLCSPILRSGTCVFVFLDALST